MDQQIAVDRDLAGPKRRQLMTPIFFRILTD